MEAGVEQLKLLPEHPRRGDELELEAVEELQPGAQWQARFQAMWPAYRAWYGHPGERPDLATCRRALAEHMPELVGTYERLCELAGGGAARARCTPHCWWRRSCRSPSPPTSFA